MKNKTVVPIVIHQSPTKRYICYNDVVGRGSYKIVYRGYDKHQGKEVAWNMVKVKDMDEREITMIIQEVMLLKTLTPQNRYIINFHNAWLDETNGELHFITGLALSGTLKQYISRNNHINMRVIKKWSSQILEGIEFLHNQHIVHRDLKCNNIFINSNTGDILIGDLGLAKRGTNNNHSVIGTPEYMAPEMMDDKDIGYDEKVDIYAFGMCMLEMITNEIPFKECTGIGHLFKKIASHNKPDSLYSVKSPEARSIIEQCIHYDPKERPSSTTLRNNSFFTLVSDLDNDEELICKDYNNKNPLNDSFNNIKDLVLNDSEGSSSTTN